MEHMLSPAAVAQRLHNTVYLSFKHLRKLKQNQPYSKTTIQAAVFCNKHFSINKINHKVRHQCWQWYCIVIFFSGILFLITVSRRVEIFIILYLFQLCWPDTYISKTDELKKYSMENVWFLRKNTTIRGWILLVLPQISAWSRKLYWFLYTTPLGNFILQLGSQEKSEPCQLFDSFSCIRENVFQVHNNETESHTKCLHKNSFLSTRVIAGIRKGISICIWKSLY